MTGPRGGVIGVRKEQAIESLRTQMPVRFETTDEDPWLNGRGSSADAATRRARCARPRSTALARAPRGRASSATSTSGRRTTRCRGRTSATTPSCSAMSTAALSAASPTRSRRRGTSAERDRRVRRAATVTHGARRLRQPYSPQTRERRVARRAGSRSCGPQNVGQAAAVHEHDAEARRGERRARSARREAHRAPPRVVRSRTAARARAARTSSARPARRARRAPRRRARGEHRARARAPPTSASLALQFSA